jgi:hydroxypyruvate reductase
MDPEQDIRSIFFRALERVDPRGMIKSAVRLEGSVLLISRQGQTLREDLSAFSEVVVLGIGKASSRMGAAMEEILGDRISQGLVITKHGHADPLDHIAVREAGHPVPDEGSVSGAEALLDLVRRADERTLIVNLISGGGSALFSLPALGVTLADKQETTRVLLESGADIREINCIRKHLSQVKGGLFARAAHPARVINLILSDVVGDRLDTIASGIAVPDETTFDQALGIVDKLRIRKLLPAPVVTRLEAGSRGEIPDTPKPGDRVFERVTNILLGNNLSACNAARDHGRALGYRSFLLTSMLTGEAREAARFFAAIARDMKRGAPDFPRPALIVAGGETTVTIRGAGRGGRNQEMALSFINDFHQTAEGMEGIWFLSAGTDGTDGPTDAAGALVGPMALDRAWELGLETGEYLDENDSYTFFQKAGGLFVTGPTGTNVCDIQLMIVS